MVITYYGGGFIKAVFGDTVIAINPIDKVARFGADIALVSLSDDLFSGVAGLTGGGKEPFVIEGPGEYEYLGTFVKGYESTGPNGKVNTIYSFILEGMRVVCLGGLATNNIWPETLEEINGADLLIGRARPVLCRPGPRPSLLQR